MHLVFDFDGTITQKDTIGVLVDSALSLQKERGQDLAARWDHVIKAYTDDAKALKESFRPAESDRTSLDEERKFLAAQYEVDEASLSRVSASGIFAGIEKEQYFQFGKNAVQNGQILIRAGFRELVNFAATQGWSVHVISINWSSDFIAGALHPFDANLIIANDLSIDGTIQGPEVIQRKLTSPWDKLDAFKIVTATSKAKVVYFGDSVNDVECLIRGGVAIADSQDTSLLKMLRRVGMQTPRLSIQTTQSSLTWASDFGEFMKANSLEPPPSLETRQ
jgi:phosphoserine phosphatase